jgi:hypothetical protein
MTSFSGTTPTDAVELQKLLASDPTSTDYFGYSVFLSSDGSTAIVGAYREGTSPNTNQGAAYVFTRTAGTWTQQAKLLASDAASDDRFGISVALSSDGSTAIVGAYQEDTSPNTENGAAYVFTRTAGTWTQQQKLTASNAASTDYFGRSVSLSSDGLTAIIGAYEEDTSPNTDNGAAYVFTLSAGVWSEQQKLTASDAASSDEFGYSVSLSSDGNTAIVGSYLEETSPNVNQGAAYVFTRTAGVWTEQQKLVASDAASSDWFGISVALSSDGNTAIIGAEFEDTSPNSGNGAAYVFTRTAGTWTQQQKLTASDAASDDRFGSSVALSSDGNTAIIIANLEDTSPNTENGAAYVFTRTAGTWTQQAKLLASDAASSDYFGSSVAISSDGTTAIIGAWFEDTSPNSGNGAAYIYALGRTLDNKLYSYDSTTGAWDVSAFGELLAPTFSIFTSSDTFEIPTGAKVIKVTCIGAGGGGGGGARNSTIATYSGGSGGGGGGISDYIFRAQDLGGAGASVTVTVGTGGTAGAVNATGTTALVGNAGVAGGTTSISSGASTFLQATGGGAGAGGVTTGTNAVGASGIGMFGGNGPGYTSALPGGGQGGQGSSSGAGASGGIPVSSTLTAATGSVSANGSAGASDAYYNGAGGGGAGGASSTTNGLTGGAGGSYGGGGGGGGEGSTAGASGRGGAGGAGGAGLVTFTVWYG